MRTLFFAFLGLLFLNSSVSGQSIVFNPKVGYGFSAFENQVEGNNFGDIDTRLMLNIGADVRIGSGSFFFITGAHYTKDDTEINNSMVSEVKNSINFIRVPLQAGLRLTGQGGILDLHLKGGLINNFFLSSSGNVLLPESAFAKYNSALNFGIGADLFQLIHVGLEMDWGLNNYFSKDFSFIESKKQAITLSVGIVF